MKKLITESELKDRVNRLKEYMAVVESNQVNEINLGALGTGAMNAVRGAGSTIANGAKKFFGSTAGKVATGTAAGAGALAAGQALTKPGQAAAPAAAGQGGKPAAGKSDPNVMALQQKLIAAGAKIKADGIMGPATRAAQAQFPNVTTQTDAEKAAASGQDAAPAPAPAPAPTMTAADQEDADTGAAMTANAAAAAQAATQQANGVDANGNNVTMANGVNPETGVPANPGTPAAGVAFNQGKPAAAPTAAPGTPAAGVAFNQGKPAAAPTAAPGTPPPPAAALATDWESSPVAASKLTPQEKALAQKSGMATTPAQLAALAKQNMAAMQAGQPISATPTQESRGYQNDELTRIISLVHHR